MLRFCCLIGALCFFIGMTEAVEQTQGDEKTTRRKLFDFSKPQSLSRWKIVNDGVMGGRSSSRVEKATEQRMSFSGTLSLANNGGFASTRSRDSRLRLAAGDTIVLKVKGDGRQYTFNLYVPRRRMAFSYRSDFKTVKDEWIEVRIPLDQLVATSFGTVVKGMTLNPAEVNSVGILLGDKRPGPFKILIESIEVQPNF
ncbi:MAG: CIA30 family protein [Rubripirellula sp.]|nr:CIA30 family protein [Rubripirellula sp.]